jgi:anaerobic selenocysteine-containing dehydrogenase
MPQPLPEFAGRETIVDTACPLDCPDGCSLAITVRNGKILTIDGSRRNETTGGYICAKVRRFDQRVYGDSRLQYPAVQKGPRGSGRFARITWDEAIELIASKMIDIRNRWGAEAILPYSYGGSNGLLSQDTTDGQLFRRFGASRLARTVCAAPTGAANQALYGKMPSVSYEDYPHAKLIVMWGANPSASGIHLIPYVREAQRRGGKLVVVDPRTTPLARQADLHLALKPGTDVVVALAVHRYLFETGRADEAFLAAHTRGSARLRERAEPWTMARASEIAGIDQAALEQFAELYAVSSPALVRCGWGLERNRNGGNAALAVLALPAVGGKFGVRGGGYTMSNSASWDITRPWLGSEPRTRLLNMNHLGRDLLERHDPPIKMLFVYNANPVATVPDQQRIIKGLMREDLFTVVFDQVMTDTAILADLVLPATTFLESDDFARSYGPLRLQLARPVVEPIGEARPNAEVFGELCRRLDLLEPAEPSTEIEVLLHVMDSLPTTVAQQIREDRPAEPPCGFLPVQFGNVLPRTGDQKVDLFPEVLEAEAGGGLYSYLPDPATDQYPLALISPASDRTISSTLGELPRPQTNLLMHPSDATRRNLEEGDVVRIYNALGAVECSLTIGTWIRPGTVSLPKGLWRKSTKNQLTATALVPDSLTDFAGGACFNDARVEVTLVERPVKVVPMTGGRTH